MKLNMYVVYDTVGDSIILIGNSRTDGQFIRDNMQFLQRYNSNYMNDFIVYCVGAFVESSMEFENCPRRQVSWDSYQRPESDEGKLRLVTSSAQ